ncbi:hypothetical protein GAYE_SCF63G6661 [Galdieria yellowstonensis]|uniref:Uncharacterized protein n=1 Tax=Galdieria yellowstonensis TaxID=3028027 RepID=A0AAV9IMT5_9RHOD|nr:hypothetical protein GAYE_SCF63G6661 [Galdieria yellowstonensis]
MVRQNEVSLVSSCKVGSSLSAISCDASEKFLIAGGREVLRLFCIENKVLKETRNLRSARRKGLKYSINDICWHKLSGYDTLVLSGSTDGSLVLWDLAVDMESASVSPISFSYSSFSTRKKSTEPRFISAHERAINKVDWHHTIPYNFLSCSQDGGISFWDLRDFGSSNTPLLNLCCSKSDPVRDASFSPHQPYWIGGGYESGNFLLWDIRKPDAQLFSIRAHTGLLFSISWHPSKTNVIATGGRDKIIRVWDLVQNEHTTEQKPSFMNKEPLNSGIFLESSLGWKETCSLSTIAAISKVSWRPRYEDQMASASSVLDTRISVWDIHRPYLPIISLRGHRDTVSCLVWESNGNLLFSCSKNGAIVIQQVDKGYKPYSFLRNNVFALSTNRSIAFSTLKNPCHSVCIWKQSDSQRWRLNLLYQDSYAPVGAGIGVDEDIFQRVCSAVSPYLRSKADKDSSLSYWEWKTDLCKELTWLYANLELPHHEFVWSTFYEFMRQLSGQSSSRYMDCYMYSRILELFRCLVIQWWRFFSDLGDVQTCSLILIFCWDLTQSSWKPFMEEAQATILSYLDILRKMQMHVAATQVQNASPFPEICHWNRSNTTVEDSRTAGVPMCCICQRQVRGLYSWCQGCGHGAHTTCIANWFVGSDFERRNCFPEQQLTCIRSVCPVPMCEHRCVYPR